MASKGFWKDLKDEYRQIIWPSKEELFRKTLLVLGISVFLTLLVMVLDFVFGLGLGTSINNLTSGLGSM